MLTKNLLKYTIRKQKAYPKFIDPKDPAVIKIAEELSSIYQLSIGKTVSNLQEQVGSLRSSASPLFDGFNKLLMDRTESSSGDDTDQVVKNRMNVVLESQSLRQEKPFDSLKGFYEELEIRMGSSVKALHQKLYADLPECQVLQSFKRISSSDLAHRYNCAQVQGLLLAAHKMKVSLKSASISFKRYLFRQIKFHRLLVEIVEDSPFCFAFELSGPLSVFSSRQTYSMRLANFFPHVLHADDWALEAYLTLKQKKVELRLDQTSGIKSHYLLQEPYIPKELSLFVEKLNKKQKNWVAEVSSDFLNLGKKQYCFPDITLKGKKESNVHLELFHRWHFSQLVDRLKFLEALPSSPLVIGCCESFSKNLNSKNS